MVKNSPGYQRNRISRERLLKRSQVRCVMARTIHRGGVMTRTLSRIAALVAIVVAADIRGTGVTEYLVASRGSLRVDTHRLDHLGPFFGFVGDELIEIDGRAHQRRATELGEPRLDPGIG